MNKYTAIKGANVNQITLSPTLAQRQAELQAAKEHRFEEKNKIVSAELKRQYEDQVTLCKKLVQRIQDKLQSEVRPEEIHWGHLGSIKTQELDLINALGPPECAHRRRAEKISHLEMPFLSVSQVFIIFLAKIPLARWRIDQISIKYQEIRG